MICIVSMTGISPSRISPTRSRTPVSDAATEGEHVIAGTDHVDSGNLNDQMIRKLTATMGKRIFLDFYEIYNLLFLSFLIL